MALLTVQTTDGRSILVHSSIFDGLRMMWPFDPLKVVDDRLPARSTGDWHRDVWDRVDKEST